MVATAKPGNERKGSQNINLKKITDGKEAPPQDGQPGFQDMENKRSRLVAGVCQMHITSKGGFDCIVLMDTWIFF